MVEVVGRHKMFSVSVAVILSDDRGKVLLWQQDSQEKKNGWSPVAGGVEEGEDPMMAAKRESHEEIAVTVGLIDLIGIYSVQRKNHHPGIGFAFRGFIESGKISPKKGEIKDYDYFSEGKFLEMLANGKIYKPEYNRQSILDYFAGKSYSLEVIQPVGS